MNHDFGLPMWVFGTSSYIPYSNTELLCCYNTQGTWQLASVHVDFAKKKHKLQNIETPFTEFIYFAAGKGCVSMLAASDSAKQRCRVRH